MILWWYQMLSVVLKLLITVRRCVLLLRAFATLLICPGLSLIVKSNLYKNENHLACILLVFVETFICFRASWSVEMTYSLWIKTLKPYNPLSYNSCLYVVQFLFAIVIFSLWKAIGCPPWLNTALTPIMLASHSSSNTWSKSGSIKTRVDLTFKFLLEHLKTFTIFFSPYKLLLKKIWNWARNAAEISDKPTIKWSQPYKKFLLPMPQFLLDPLSALLFKQWIPEKIILVPETHISSYWASIGCFLVLSKLFLYHSDLPLLLLNISISSKYSNILPQTLSKAV